MAGRVSLINSVIMGQLMYSFQVYKWLTVFLKDLTSSIRNFLWSGSSKTTKPIVASWKMCCKSKDNGGLGLRDPIVLNAALLKKLAWSLMTLESFVFRFLRGRFFSKGFTPRRFWKSSIWCGLRNHIQTLIDESIWAVGRNSKVHFWTGNWLGSPLTSLISYSDNLEPSIDAVIGDVTSDFDWSLPASFVSSFPQIADDIRNTVISDSDTLIWRHSVSGSVTCADSYTSLAGVTSKERWGSKFWASFIPPSRSLVFWRLLQNKLSTEKNLIRRGFLCHRAAAFVFLMRKMLSTFSLVVNLLLPFGVLSLRLFREEFAWMAP